MKIILEIKIPEYDWIDVPTSYDTPIGIFSCSMQVDQIKYLIEYLRRLSDIKNIINSNPQHVRLLYCRELIRSNLKFIEEKFIYYYGNALSDFLSNFSENTGLDFLNYKFEYKVLSNGKKIKFKNFDMLFDNETEAYRHIVKIYTSTSNYEFTTRDLNE